MQQQIDKLKAQTLSLKEASTKSKCGDDQDNVEMIESKMKNVIHLMLRLHPHQTQEQQKWAG
eukprot:845547-Ditylum_brightwellii.AAC.1